MEFQLTPQVNVDELQAFAQLTINTTEQFTAADKQLGEIKSRRKQIVDFFAEPKKRPTKFGRPSSPARSSLRTSLT